MAVAGEFIAFIATNLVALADEFQPKNAQTAANRALQAQVSHGHSNPLLFA
jgi:hypothetical protein